MEKSKGRCAARKQIRESPRMKQLR